MFEYLFAKLGEWPFSYVLHRKVTHKKTTHKHFFQVSASRVSTSIKTYRARIETYRIRVF